MKARDDHPNDDTLVDLAARLLTSDETEIALGHLKQCVACEERFCALAADREWFVSAYPGKRSAPAEPWRDARELDSRPSALGPWGPAGFVAVCVFAALLHAPEAAVIAVR